MNPIVRPEDLARFVPICIRKRVSNPAVALNEPGSEPSLAAVLFADISGFTALSERLGALGANGVEELTQTLNGYFGQLISIVVANAGDVVKFAGDALLAYWPVDSEGELVRVVNVVGQCGLQVQEALQQFALTTGHRLSLRVGIGAGNTSVVSVGGIFNRWECVLVGPAVNEATLAATVAEPGAVVVGTAAWQRLKSTSRGEELTPEYTRLDSVTQASMPTFEDPIEVSTDLVPKLLPFVPAAIHRRLAAQQSAWLAEMRRLTVIFVNLPGLNYSAPLSESQAVMTALQSELYRFEGSVNKLSTDEKGVTLVAALGLPPLAHEDDPLRGVLAALAIQATLQKLGWKNAIGVTSGRVFCGTIGSEERCEFTMIGGVVNMSARLMQAAKGSILCDQITYEEASDKIEWEVLPPIMVKGRTEPIAVFRPLRVSNTVNVHRFSQGMVGRATEQKRLLERANQLVHNQKSGVVLIEGEAGIGKSTLVAEILRNAHHLKLKTWLGAALAIERLTPYFVWRAIFRQLFHLDTSENDLEKQRQQVLAHLQFDRELLALAPLLDSVLSLDFPPTPLTSQMFGEVRLANTNSLLLRLLRHETEQSPLQLVLEDCHWLDSSSWGLLRDVAMRVPNLLIIVVTRPLTDPLPRDYVPLASAPTTEKWILSPLSPEDTVTLVKRRLGVNNIPPSMQLLLQTKAQGNPFFIEELAYSLRDTGKIQILDGNCTVAPGEDLQSLPFPDNVQGVVTSRIDRLAPPEQLTLKVASVIGRTFSRDILRDVSPIEEDRKHLDVHLDTLIRQSLTMLDSPDPDPLYSFKHVITQEVSYQMMPPAQRKRLHQVVAEWYESHHNGDLSPFFPLLAKHWSNTERLSKAIDYLEKSGELAMRNCAHEEAVTFFSQAIALDAQSPTPSDRYRRGCWERQLAEAYYNLSDLGTALKHYTIALELVGYPLPRSSFGFVFSGMWEFVKQQLHRGFPTIFFGRAKSSAPKRLEAARAYERLVQIHYLNNAKVPSVHAAFRALNLSETVGECPELARNLSHASVFSGLLMMHGSARKYANVARAMAERVDELSCSAYVEFIRGVYWVTVGEWEEAQDNLERAIKITEVNGERRRWYESAFTLANTLSRKGDYPGSVKLSQEIHERGTRRGVPQVQVWGFSWRVVCLLAIEPDHPRLPELTEQLSQCLKTHPNIPLADQILGYGILAMAQWRRGDKDLARETTESAEKIISQTNQISHYLLPAYLGLTEVYFGVWREHKDQPAIVEEMARRTRHLIKVLGEFRMMYPIGSPTHLLIQGQHAWMIGKESKAIRCWKKSLAAAERYRMPFEQQQAREMLASVREK